MFKNLFQRVRERRAVRDWQHSQLGQALDAHVKEYFTTVPRFAQMDADDKQQTVAELGRLVSEVLQTQNPVMKLRESMANLVLAFAELQVLCLTEAEKPATDYADCPYISGELHHCIAKAVPHVDFLRELKWKQPEPADEDLVGLCNLRSGRYVFYLNGLNYVRRHFKDYDERKDWFRPFVKSMLICHEDMIRQKMGLQSLVPSPLVGLQHSTFMNLVVNGAANPYFEWEKAYANA